ncbi:mucin-13 [Fukomys damarensis]|uniref:mucin-13 n=1 Tax=Fukomys damarensis TaxID=885580 RepID=UPI00053FBE35|nr:mucin-13 [Fukomys damarensis]
MAGRSPFTREEYQQQGRSVSPATASTVMSTTTDTYASGSPLVSITATPDPPTASTTFPTSATTIVTVSSQTVTSSPNHASSPPTVTTLISSVQDTTASPGQSTLQMSSAVQGGSSGISTSGLPQKPTSSIILSSTTSNTSAGLTGPSSHCQEKPCGEDVSCVNLYEERICLCLEGYYYSSMKCFKGKTFPGQITIMVTDTSDLQNEGSPAYQTLWSKINTFFTNAFTNTDYKQTVVHTVSTSPQQARSASVSVRIVNLFEKNTTENETTIEDKINEANKSSVNILSYSKQEQCEYYGCEDTHQDNCSSSVNCQCKNGLQRPFPQSPFCLTLQCSEDCKAEDKKQCLKNSTGELTCACLPGYQRTHTDHCQECPFGYSGMDCEDQFQLILTIVGTILGVLVLSLVIALVVSMRSKNRKKDIEEQKLMENDFQNLQLQQTGFSNLAAEGSLFPRVKTKEAPKDYQNPYTGQ